MKLAAKERAVLRLFRDDVAGATASVRAEERRALQAKGLLCGPGRYGGWSLTPAGRAALLGTSVRLTAHERRALRHFQDDTQSAAARAHANTRHALERKGLLRHGGIYRGWILTDAGHAALAPPPDVPDIFADLFPAKKEARR